MRRIRCFHPSIDRLKEIEEAMILANSEQLAKLSDEFYKILTDLKVDGVWKKTQNYRLNIADEKLLETLKSMPNKQLDFLDVGCSDAITTVNFVMQAKSKLSVLVKPVMMDKNFSIVRQRKLGIKFYRTKYGKPFFIQLGWVGLMLEESCCREAIIFNPIVHMLNRLIKKHMPLQSVNRSDLINLISPVARGISNSVFFEGDVLHNQKSFIDSFDVIRASNILNLGYFSKEQLLMAISHLKVYLRESGLLLISRNTNAGGNETEHGTIWKKHGKQLVAVTDFGCGSEIRHIVEKSK